MFKKVKKIIAPLALTASAILSPVAVMAQDLRPTVGGTQVPQNIISIIGGVIRFIIVAAFIIAFVMLVVGGIRWIFAGGDEKAVAGARNTITAALIGLVIVLAAFALIRLVETFFGIQILTNPCIPTPAGGCVALPA